MVPLVAEMWAQEEEMNSIQNGQHIVFVYNGRLFVEGINSDLIIHNADNLLRLNMNVRDEVKNDVLVHIIPSII